jgi:hypothetical protein
MAMRKSLGSIALLAILAAGAAHADCHCPNATLDDHISGASMIFAGKPLMFAQIPAGSSPFHSEQSMESMGRSQNDVVIMFDVETVWKGQSSHRIKVRHERGECVPDFKLDVPVVVFAQADSFGILWTKLCSGNAATGDAGYDELRTALTSRLRYN